MSAAASHVPPAARRRRQRQDAGGRGGRHHRHRERLSGGACWRPRRSWRRSTTSISRSCSRSSATSTILLTGSYTAREKLQLQETDRRQAWRTSSSARTRCSKRTSSSSGWAWRSSTSSIVSAWSSARRCSRRARTPDVLVMTATPIPRTLALTIYGDLDVSVIDELPPGRKPIVTKHVTEDQRRAGLQLPQEADRRGPAGLRRLSGDRGVGDAGHEGRAEDARASFARSCFPACTSACCTGKLPADEKEAAMERFQRGRDPRFWSRPR